MTGSHPFGYIESAQQLVGANSRSWDNAELLRAAEASQLPNTGWPIGIVFRRPDLRPKTTGEGIEFRHVRDRAEGGPGWEDFWSLQKDGSYYVVRIFEEDFHTQNGASNGARARQMWLDTRIWRIAEVMLHSAALYRELRVGPQERYVLAVNHGGLSERTLATTDPVRRQVRESRTSYGDEARWTTEVTQDYVVLNLKHLVAEVARDLFSSAAFGEVPDEVIYRVVDEFQGVPV